MNKIFFLTALIFLFVELQGQMTWTNKVQADLNNGSYPHLDFSKDGDLFLFYYDQSSDSLILRREFVPGSTLSQEINITAAAKNMAIHFASGDTIDLMVAKGTAHWILQSSDSGMTWNQKGSVPSTSNLALPTYMSGRFTEDGNNLRLIYSYLYYNAVFGEKPQAFQVNRTNSTWATGALVKDGEVTGAYENGTDVCILSDRGTYFSNDNGLNYSTLSDGVPMPEQLKAADADSWENKIFLIHGYTYGPGGADQNITFTSSSDNGLTWDLPQTAIVNGGADYMFYPKFSVAGDTLVACWLSGQSTQPGINGYINLLSTYSFDGGAEWSAIDTVYSCTPNQVIPSDYAQRADIDLGNFNERFIIAFTVMQGLNEHVYISESSYTSLTVADDNRNKFLKGLIYPNPANNLIHIKNEIAVLVSVYDIMGKEVISTYSNTINIGPLKPGMYSVFLRDTKHNIISIEKIVRE